MEKDDFQKKFGRLTSTQLIKKLETGIEFQDEKDAVIAILEKRGKDVEKYKLEPATVTGKEVAEEVGAAPVEEVAEVVEETPKAEEPATEAKEATLEELADAASDLFDSAAEKGDTKAYAKMEAIVKGRDFVDMERDELVALLAIKVVAPKKAETPKAEEKPAETPKATEKPADKPKTEDTGKGRKASKSITLEVSVVNPKIKKGVPVKFTKKGSELTGIIHRVYNCHIDNIEKCSINVEKGVVYKPTKNIIVDEK